MGSQHHVTGGERPDMNLTSIYKRDDQKSTSCKAKIPGNFWRMNCFRRVTSTFPGMVWSRMRQEALMWNVSWEVFLSLPDERDAGPDEGSDVHHWHYRVDVIAVLRHNHLQMWICIKVALVEEKRCWLLGFERGLLNLEVDGTAYREGEKNPEKVPANVCHLWKRLVWVTLATWGWWIHLGSEGIFSYSPSLMMAVAPNCEIGQAPNGHL